MSRRLVALSVLPAAGQTVVVQGRNDVVIREVFRCLDEDGQSRPFTYHLGRADYGYALWTLTTKFEFRNLSPYGHAMGPHHKEDLAIIVVYDSREDGSPDDLPLVEARVMEILSGARKHIAHDGTVHWGPFTIVQDLANQRFAIDHRQPYSGGGQGQVEIVVGPQSDGVRGAVRSRDTNLINYNGPLTSCTFNTAPVPPLRLK